MTIDKNEIADLAKAIRSQINTRQTLSSDELLINALNKGLYSDSDRLLLARKNKAIAQHMNTATITGYVKAKASTNNPLITPVELFITDFAPNKNKQGIKKSEAQNIIATAKNSPLKINVATLGHSNAMAVGTITDVLLQDDRITGNGVLWKSEDETLDMLSDMTEITTSWEIYYEDSEVDSNGVSWLQGCIFAGLCFVSNPAYGSKAKAKIVR
jgi:hypothetical protein